MSRDHLLMRRLHAGDVAALDEVLQEYWHPLVSYAAGILSDRDDAEDVVQEVMLRVWRRRGEWTPTSHLRAFLYRLTRNQALNARSSRKAARERWRTAEEREPREGVPTPLEVTEGWILWERVEAVLEALPPRRREVFILARYHGHSYREIAEVLDVAPQTVANHMTAALEDLRNAIRPAADPSSSRS